MADMLVGLGFTYLIFVKVQIIGYFYGFLFLFDLTTTHHWFDGYFISINSCEMGDKS